MRKYTRLLFIAIPLLAVIVVVLLLLMPLKKSKEEANQTFLASQKEASQREILYYTCGMHPSVRVTPEDYEKGNTKCPICNMDLVPVYKEEGQAMAMETGEHEEHGTLEALVKLSPRARALASVRTEEIQYLPLFREISTVGEMDYDERKVAYVAAWVPGRIDRLFVDFTGVEVKKGDPLVSIYSPQLLTTQEEYLLALETLDRVRASGNEETIKGAESLVEASKRRLLLWGISEEQVDELRQRKKADTHMTIYAPIGGTVIHKNAFEGKYVKEGENLYQIAGLSNLWVRADIYEYEMAWIKSGQEVEITTSAYPGERFEGTVSFIDPFLNPKTRSVKVRINVPNPRRRLKPGMYVNVAISSTIHEGIPGPEKAFYTCPMHPEVISENPGDCPICGMHLEKKPAPSGSILSVPKDAVLDTGARKLVYVEREEGTYQAIEVEIGPEAEAYINGEKQRFYAVKAGLDQGMRVVTQANFLIDSQSQITGQAEAVYGGALEKEKKNTPPSKHIH
jgi:Cu(I)/Ag(I) efflux system membrane fusion protein